ncbi:MAG: hypothetical protein EHM47_10130 [Ignavibacteriales bacterium]|nr:MAG: hypothetical protein EHM47_10130 [Ignavibacteriales bacterium]
MSKNKLLFLVSMAMLIYLSGCVDTSVENISPQDYKSSVRFENEAGAAATIAVDGSQVSTVASGQMSSYVEVNSGSRNIQATYPSGQNINESISLETDLRITISIVEDSTGARSLVKHIDGYR